MAVLGNFVFYADDPEALSHFWAKVFGYPIQSFDGELREYLVANGLTDADLKSRGLAEDPEHVGPRLFFHHASAPKTQRNRVHMDLNAVAGRRATHDELEAEKERLIALGASVVRFVDQQWGPWPEYYYQMQDPEGNEFCLQG